MQILAHHHVQHGQGERVVCAGAYLQEDVGPGGYPGLARVDDDDLGSLAHEIDEPVVRPVMVHAAADDG